MDTLQKTQRVEARTNPSNNEDQAVVIGGSIAGLLTARVLADHFAEVVIIERDRLPEQPELRQGVPQSAQPHVLFARGYRILEELFPGIGGELSKAGALAIDWAREFYRFGYGGWNATTSSPSDIVSVTCSRPLLEWVIRQRLCHSPRVRFLEGYRVNGLLTNANQKVTGVSLHSKGTGVVQLPGKLVVDASGRGSQAPHWLKSLGLTPPEETVINPFLGYATRRYQAPQEFQPDWKVMLISQSPPNNTRLGYIAQIEGKEWIVTLGGYGRDFPPLDGQGFLEFAHSLPSPEFYQMIQAAKPVSPIYAHRATANRLRHYEKTPLPEGFVVLGDAVCALCPVYGQGMTVSATSVLVLRDWLHPGGKKAYCSLDFQRQLAKNNSLPWSMATTQDLRFPTTAGRNQPNWLARRLGKLLGGYTERALQRTNEDSAMHTLIMEVGHQLKSPAVLYHPQVIFRVLVG